MGEWGNGGMGCFLVVMNMNWIISPFPAKHLCFVWEFLPEVQSLDLKLVSAVSCPLACKFTCIVHVVLRGFKQLHLRKMEKGQIGKASQTCWLILAISSSRKLAPPVPKAIPKYSQTNPRLCWLLCGWQLQHLLVFMHGIKTCSSVRTSELGRHLSELAGWTRLSWWFYPCDDMWYSVHMCAHAVKCLAYVIWCMGSYGFVSNRISKSNGLREDQVVFLNAFHKHGIWGYAACSDTSHTHNIFVHMYVYRFWNILVTIY